jgi:hypothetical protein
MTARRMLQIRQAVDRYALSEQTKRLVFPALLALYACALLLNAALHLLPLAYPALAGSLYLGLDVNPLSSSASTLLFTGMNAVRLVVAMQHFRAARLLFRGQSKGWEVAHQALVLAIVALDFLVFYFSQFSAAIVAVFDMLLLGWVNHVQRSSLTAAHEARGQ